MNRPLLLLVAGLCVLVSACGDGPKAAVQTGPRLTIWESYNTEEHAVFMEVVRRFEEKMASAGTPLHLDVYRVPFDGLLPKLKAACLTGTTPDICRVDYAHVVPMAYGNAVIALDELPGFEYKDLDILRREYVPAAIDSCLLTIRRRGQVSRHLYGLPDQTNCVALFYNKTLLAAAAQRLTAVGLSADRTPADLTELIAYAKALTIPSVSQYGLGLDNSLWWNLPFFNTHGAAFVQQDATGLFTSVLDNPEAIEALDYRVGLSRTLHTIDGIPTTLEAGCYRPGMPNKDQGFITGKYAMILSGPWSLKTFRESELNFGVGMIPKGPAGTSSTVGGTNMVVFRSCQRPTQAWKFLEHLTSHEVQKEWCSRLGQIPVRPALFNQVDVTARPELKIFFDQMMTARARPPIPNYDKVEEIANAQMELALQGVKTSAQALHEASERINLDVLDPIRE